MIEPSHKDVGIQCEITLSDSNVRCQTDQLESIDFEAQAPEYYSIPANYEGAIKDHPYSKQSTVSSTPAKRKRFCDDVHRYRLSTRPYKLHLAMMVMTRIIAQIVRKNP